MIGTVVNSAAIIVGSGIGLMLHSKLSSKVQDIIFQAIGISTCILGVMMALKTQNFLIIILSSVIGSVIGQIIDINKFVKTKTEKLTKNRGGEKASQGFISASLIFCIGSLAILGPIEEGLGNPPTLLYTKSVMDGVVAITLAASYGIAVMFSSVTVFVYQVLLTLFAAWMAPLMSDAIVGELTAVGGVMLVGLGLTILNIKEINVINMIPSLIFAAIFAYILL